MGFLEDLLLSNNDHEDGDFMPIFSIEEEDESSVKENFPEVIPLLALKNTVLFPGIVVPITVGRQKSITAIETAYDKDRVIGVLSQIQSKTEDPEGEDLYRIGTVARIIKLLKMPDGTTTAILQGRKRFELKYMTKTEPYLEGSIEIKTPADKVDDSNLEFQAIITSIRELAGQIVQLSPNIPSEASMMLKNIANDAFLLNFIASNIGVDTATKQGILEEDETMPKAENILEHMNKELQLLRLRDKIETKVKVDIDKQQRDYFLHQQLKTIQEELGQNPQHQEVEALVKRAKTKQWDETVQKHFEKEIKKLKRTNPQVAEYSIMLNYLEVLLDLPWNEGTEDNFDLKSIQTTLDEDHFGLEKVKDRIIEHLAVLKLKGDMKAPILCLLGPPGVGKTSLGRSIAKALDRKYIRMALGGLNDESEVRGHRKTYIGAMPGRIIQSMKKSGSSNPVFILDEIDKVGKSFRGDPSSALLEVLDPEQNKTFYDNYLELDYDLSKVLFIATANSLSTIQPALLDRMEIIQISGYSLEEKIEIAKRHLIPQELKEHGLEAKQVKIRKEVLSKIIDSYTRESGVRSLKRRIAGVMRNVAKNVAMEEEYEPNIKIGALEKILGPTRYERTISKDANVPGVAVGLAWTSVGGDILFIETSISKGKGNLTLTGNLGNVMKESATTALSLLRAKADKIGLDVDVIDKRNIHLHVPEGAIPKDGPSAGITMLTALTSAFLDKPIKKGIAMTGEITLRGKVLPVGGIKEKMLAAKRAGLTDIILCKENKKHVEEITAAYIKGLNFHYVDNYEEVLKIALIEK